VMPAGTVAWPYVFRPQATTVPGWTGPGEVAAAVGVATGGVGVAGGRVNIAAVAVVVGTLTVVAVDTLAVVGVALAVVGVAPLDAQAATIVSSPPMRAALVIPVRASGCPIIWIPPVGTHAESSEDEDHAASIATPSSGDGICPPGGARVAKRTRVSGGRAPCQAQISRR
jgi:hypothetical protein